jgi:cation diffusion facilitator CzcD-associated flavoprotein CzcO
VPDARYDAVVVGAGPYGLSAAAHLLGRGLNVAIFGKTLELWREHMPRGMLLRSQRWATSLSDPDRRYTFARFFRESGYRAGYPVPLDTFIEYALWFQRKAVPVVDETYVTSIARRDGYFLLTLEDGRRVESAAVVMAIGLRCYAHRPEEFSGLPAGLVSHSSDLRDLDGFRDRRVVVVGGGQSAVEYAALLHEAGATVDLVTRHRIVWLERDRTGERGVVERIRAPDTGIGPGWKNWVLEHLPFLFYRLPRSTKDRALITYSGAWAADWLRDRIANNVNVHEGHIAISIEAHDRKVNLTLSDGARIGADHVVLATGYRVDLDKLPMIDPALRAEIKTEMGVPVLGPSFETTVPGLYFVGATSLRSFGPIYRFVLGCRSAAPRVADSIARRQRVRKEPWTTPGPEALAPVTSQLHRDQEPQYAFSLEDPGE